LLWHQATQHEADRLVRCPVPFHRPYPSLCFAVASSTFTTGSAETQVQHYIKTALIDIVLYNGFIDCASYTKTRRYQLVLKRTGIQQGHQAAVEMPPWQSRSLPFAV
jgi:hypothetical protein